MKPRRSETPVDSVLTDSLNIGSLLLSIPAALSCNACSLYSCMKRALVLVITEIEFKFWMRQFRFSDLLFLDISFFFFVRVSSFARVSDTKWEGEGVVRDVGQMAAVVRWSFAVECNNWTARWGRNYLANCDVGVRERGREKFVWEHKGAKSWPYLPDRRYGEHWRLRQDLSGLYIQSVPRSKQTASLLCKPVS